MGRASDRALSNAAERRENAEEYEDAYDFFKVQTDKNNHFQSVRIVQSKFLDLLKRLGYRRFDTGEGQFIVVRIQDNIIEEVALPNLRLASKNYVDDLNDDLEEITGCPKGELVEKLTCSLAALLSEANLSLLVNRDEPMMPIVEDTIGDGYHFYRNGFVTVTATGIKFQTYDKLPGYIWKAQMLPRDYTPLPRAEFEKSAYWEFLNNIADNYTIDDEGERHAPERFDALRTLIGYNLHRYFLGDIKCTILLDARMSEDADGRSGKSLFCKGLRWILNPEGKVGANCKFIDGKEFREDNRFKYEKLHRNTKMVVFNDVRKGFPIENLYNAVEDGIEKEDKGGGRSEIMAKIIITLNYTIKIQGGSAKDRVYEFEFADFYSDTKKPAMVHKQWFFRDWDAADWNRFDNIMMNCIVDYLKTGVLQAKTINLDARKLKDETSEPFITFMEELEIEHEKAYNKKDLYEQFTDCEQRTEVMTLGRTKFTQRMFTIWMRRWSEYRPEFAGYRENRSDKKDFMRFFYNRPVMDEYLEASVTAKVKLFTGKCEQCTAPKDN